MRGLVSVDERSPHPPPRLRLHQHMDSTDPLLALRRAVKSKTPITYLTDGQPAPTLLAATHLSLGPAITFPKSTPTRYTKPGVSNSSSTADVYTLEAVYLAWLLRDAPGAEYMRQARESGLTVGFVSVTERKSVVEWLEGKVADLERIRPLASGKSVPRSAVRELALVYGFVFCLCCG
jgi:parafibromin